MRNKELIVGLFVIAGFLGFAYVSLQFGEFSVFDVQKRTLIRAEFDNVSGLKQGANVEMSGVVIGKVAAISLNETDRAMIDMQIDDGYRITDDAIASIRTQGIIGDKFIKIIQGGSADMLENGDVITDTESAIDIEEMISKYIFGKM
ncbi:MAG: outer membrane lipid asymmetry maintenance protein MlaD [Thermodesulfobacteriota bacterium]